MVSSSSLQKKKNALIKILIQMQFSMKRRAERKFGMKLAQEHINYAVVFNAIVMNLSDMCLFQISKMCMCCRVPAKSLVSISACWPPSGMVTTVAFFSVDLFLKKVFAPSLPWMLSTVPSKVSH